MARVKHDPVTSTGRVDAVGQFLGVHLVDRVTTSPQTSELIKAIRVGPRHDVPGRIIARQCLLVIDRYRCHAMAKLNLNTRQADIVCCEPAVPQFADVVRQLLAWHQPHGWPVLEHKPRDGYGRFLAEIVVDQVLVRADHNLRDQVVHAVVPAVAASPLPALEISGWLLFPHRVLARHDVVKAISALGVGLRRLHHPALRVEQLQANARMPCSPSAGE